MSVGVRVDVRDAAGRRPASPTARPRCTRGGRCARDRSRAGPSPTGGPATTCAATRGDRRTRRTTSSSTTMDEHRPGSRLRSGAVGEQRRQQRVRHHDGADAAAALDRRLHRLDGGAVLRGLRHRRHYHFLTAAAMSKQSSNPVRQLRYINNDAEVGVQHMHDLGVRYLMVRTACGQGRGRRAAEGLELVDDVGPVGHLRGAGLRTSSSRSRVQPVVVDGRRGWRSSARTQSRTRHELVPAPGEWAAMPVNDGPDEWQRVTRRGRPR